MTVKRDFLAKKIMGTRRKRLPFYTHDESHESPSESQKNACFSFLTFRDCFLSQIVLFHVPHPRGLEHFRGDFVELFCIIIAAPDV